MIRKKRPPAVKSSTKKEAEPKKVKKRVRKKTAKKTADKPAAKKRAVKKAPPKKRKPSALRQWVGAKLRWLLTRSLLLFVPLLLLYTAWLDYSVRVQFEGKRWELPARVYAAPVELYAGKSMGASQLLGALRQLGYRKQSGAVDPGSYQQRENRIKLHTRPFKFWDGAEHSVHVQLTFNKGSISRIDPLQRGEEVDIIRLDPLPIGSFFASHGEDRQLVRLEELPPQLIDTLTTVEDRAFFDHYGINPFAILRAVVANIRAGRMVQGGSTLTQQLAKNLFLTRERTLTRKLREALITLILEFHYEKEEILQAYLNEVYFGQDQHRSIHGVGMASHFFFGHDASQLTLAESALLVGMLKGPSRYNPRRHPQRAKQLRDLILDLLAQQGVVSEGEANRAKRKSLGVLSHVPSGQSLYPAFLDLVRRQILRDYKREDLTTAGLQIFTTLNPLSQQAAEWGLQRRIRELGGNKKKLQGAVVVVHPESGEVEAVVGGSDPRATGFNRALHAVRPIGSLVKPALYLTALEQPNRYTLVSELLDQPFQIKSGNSIWQPDNYDKASHGAVPLYRALSRSYNLSTARLGAALGIGSVARTIERLGVERKIQRYPSLFLGSLELSPLEVAQLYQPLAGGGIHTPLRAIRGVVDHQGNPLKRYPLHVKEVSSPASIALLQWGMQEVVRDGTAKGLNRMLSPTLEIAGKTGTTDELRDSWFAGFSGDRLAVVWMGRDDNQSAGLTGSSGALHVWGRMMSKLPNQPLRIRYPEEVVEVWIDDQGRRVGSGCNHGRSIPFVQGSEPLVEVQC